MKNLNDLLKFSKYDPISRYQNVLSMQDFKIINFCNRILLVLKVIDEVLQEEFKVDYHFYIKDDSTIYILLQQLFGDNDQDMDKELYMEALEILDLCKLVYRFTCAKKFNEFDSSLHQFRINSWGRTFVETIVSEGVEDYLKMKQYVRKSVTDYFNLYQEITILLLGKLDYADLERINYLNSILEIKLLS